MKKNRKRPRRIRASANFRRMFAETDLDVRHLVQPLFAVEGRGVKSEIASMPGQYRLSVDKLVDECRELERLGIPACLLFGAPDTKDDVGSGAYSDTGIVQQAVRAIKDAGLQLSVITDVCLCAYTSHGHCGVLSDDREEVVANDESVELIARTALSHVRAGADMVAPSDMLDGRIGAVRDTLDDAGYRQIPIMSYSAKYASAFYGPFRETAASAPKFGDRASYQMDVRNLREALTEARLDLAEGADIIMVKPAMPCLDVIYMLRSNTNARLAAYMVSGEYAMIRAAAINNWVDERRTVTESLTAIRRAGADIIVTYFAKSFAGWRVDALRTL